MNEKTAQWYEHIESLVEDYKAGNSDSGLELINAFDPYFKKYIKLLKHAGIDLKDKDSRRFISLFISDAEARYGLVRRFQPKEARESAQKAAIMLKKLCEPYTEEDLKQDFCVILLNLCRRYVKKSKKKNFCGYLYNVFRYELHRRLAETTRDPLTYSASNTVSFNDTEHLTPDVDLYDDGDRIDWTPVLKVEEDLGNNWVRGLTCDKMFLDLTTLQRLIIKEAYMNGYSDYKIANDLGMHRNTILRNRMKAEDVIADSMGEEYITLLHGKRDIKTNAGIDSEED